MSDLNIPVEGLKGEIRKDILIISSASPMKSLSSSIIGGGFSNPRYLINHHVEKGFSQKDPQTYLREVATKAGIDGVFVGMMTAADLENHSVVAAAREGFKVTAVVTGGISNAATAGEEAAQRVQAGTINTILLIDADLSEAAMAGAIITATEAKTLSLSKLGVKSISSMGPATGTTTDAVVVACTKRGIKTSYSGTGTVLGELIGRSVKEATINAIKKQEGWR